jgi:hypothetical protein
MISSSDLDRRLKPLAQMLSADGYALSTSIDGDQVLLEITATATACEECLVPAEVISAMAVSYLEEDRATSVPSIRVRMPVEHHAGTSRRVD